MGLEPTSGLFAATCFQDRLLIRPDDFRRCVNLNKKFRGLESNQRPPGSEPGVTTSSNYPGSFILADTAMAPEVRGEGVEPPSPGSKPGSLPLADPRSRHQQECPAGVEPASPAWKAGTFAARPWAHARRKERELNPQGSSLVRVRAGCRRQSACPSVSKLRRQESNLRRGG